MYIKYGRIYKAQELFDKMHDANIDSWTTMALGYAQNLFSKEALHNF